VADLYYAATGQRLVVTSGTRSAASQAKAMYDKLAGGDDVYGLYANKTAVSAIIKAYDDGVQAGSSAKDIKAAMTDVINQQMASGTFISRHLLGGAVDVRITNMNASQRAAFQKAVRDQGSFSGPDEEGIPPHWHMQLKPQ
jgi:hypothetical protein